MYKIGEVIDSGNDNCTRNYFKIKGGPFILYENEMVRTAAAQGFLKDPYFR